MNQAKLFYLPTELTARLGKEHNQSKTVAEALERYFAGKDGTKALAQLTQDNNEALNELAGEVQELNKLVKKIALAMQSQGLAINL